VPAETASAHRPLAGRCFLLTRPRAESRRLAARIESAGGSVIVFPTLETEPVPLSAASREALDALPRQRLAVFISANAVRHGLQLVRTTVGWPPALQAAAVGRATADMLRAQGVRRVLTPQEGADSEALLALPELQQVQGWSVVVFRGVGGRELLADALQARGAQVAYVECYRRVVPVLDPAPVRAALAAGTLDAIVAASAEGVRNLQHMLGAECQALLGRVPLVVTHAHIQAAARTLGFERVHLAADAHDGVVDALARLHA
jgi:uroporphyrinogen-III synthase